MKDAGISGNYTGHSGKVTCATELFKAGLQEKLVKERTGHRSSVVQAYERTSHTQVAEVSKILDPAAFHDDEEKKEIKLKNGVNVMFQNCSNLTINFNN